MPRPDQIPEVDGQYGGFGEVPRGVLKTSIDLIRFSLKSSNPKLIAYFVGSFL